MDRRKEKLLHEYDGLVCGDMCIHTNAYYVLSSLSLSLC